MNLEPKDLSGKHIVLLAVLVTVSVGATGFDQDILLESRGFVFENFMGYETHEGNSKPFSFYDGSGDIVLYRRNFSGYAEEYGSPLTKVDINSHGLRDEEFSRKSDIDKTRIFVVGDSFVYGKGVNESERFTEIMESDLNSLSENKFSVINAGVSGYGASDYYRLIEKRLRYYDPDHIVVSIYRNDFISWREAKNLREDAAD